MLLFVLPKQPCFPISKQGSPEHETKGNAVMNIGASVRARVLNNKILAFMLSEI
jgi:hypothetical protein